MTSYVLLQTVMATTTDKDSPMWRLSRKPIIEQSYIVVEKLGFSVEEAVRLGVTGHYGPVT